MMLHLATLALAVAPSPFAQSELALVWDHAVHDSIEDLEVSEDGITYALVRGGELLALSPDGELLWSEQNPGSAQAVAVHPDGSVSIAGWLNAGVGGFGTPLGGSDGYVRRLDAGGLEVSAFRVGGALSERLSTIGTFGDDVVVGGTSNSLDFGSSGTDFGTVLARLDPAGTLIWASRIPVGLDSISYFDVLVEADGSGLAVGQILLNGAFDSDRFRVDFDANGALSFPPFPSNGGSWQRIERDAAGNRYIGGRTYSGGGTVGVACRFDTNQWCTFLDAGTGSPQSWIHAALPMTSGDVALCGTRAADFGPQDVPRTGIFRVNGTSGVLLGIHDLRVEPGFIAQPGPSTRGPHDGVRVSYFKVDDATLQITPDRGVARVAPLAPFAQTTCSAQPNSTGEPAVLGAAGSDLRDSEALTLFVNGLPPLQTVLFATSRTPGFTTNPGGSQGDLCLGGSIGRFVRPGELRAASPRGRVALQVDLGALPEGGTSVNALAGETWTFQAWYRDLNPGSTSNFSTAVSVLLR